MKGVVQTEEDRASARRIFRIVEEVITPKVRTWELSPEFVPIDACVANVLAHNEAFMAVFRKSPAVLSLAPTQPDTTAYFTFSITYHMFMTLRTTEAMDACFKAYSTVISRGMFEFFCNSDPEHRFAYAQYMKSENKVKPTSVYGIVEVHLSSERDVKKNIFALRDREDITQLRPDDVIRLARANFPDLTDEELAIGVAFVEKVQQLKKTDPAVVDEFMRTLPTPDDDVVDRVSRDIALNMRTCAECGRRGIRLALCSGCSDAWYCDYTCQKQHWPAHRIQCRE